MLHALALFVSRLMIIYGGGDHNMKGSALKAAFSQIYLLTETIKRKKEELKRAFETDQPEDKEGKDSDKELDPKTETIC